jgi:hypothetical protein
MSCVYNLFSRTHFNALNAWMAGSSPAMTGSLRRANTYRYKSQQFIAEKQKARYTLPMTSRAFRIGQKHARLRSGAVPTKGEPREKSPPPMQRNPLISLDSDERIQANPRQSNPHERGPSQRKAMDPRKPKTASDRPPKALDPLHPNATRFRPTRDADER